MQSKTVTKDYLQQENYMQDASYHSDEQKNRAKSIVKNL